MSRTVSSRTDSVLHQSTGSARIGPFDVVGNKLNPLVDRDPEEGDGPFSR